MCIRDSISAVERLMLFDADSIEISAEQCKKSSVSAYDIFANYNVDEDLESEAQIHPEHRCVEETGLRRLL